MWFLQQFRSYLQQAVWVHFHHCNVNIAVVRPSVLSGGVCRWVIWMISRNQMNTIERSFFNSILEVRECVKNVVLINVASHLCTNERNRNKTIAKHEEWRRAEERQKPLRGCEVEKGQHCRKERISAHSKNHKEKLNEIFLEIAVKHSFMYFRASLKKKKENEKSRATISSRLPSSNLWVLGRQISRAS